MVKSLVFISLYIALLTSFAIESAGQDANVHSGNETLLILTKKSNVSEKLSFKTGDRIKILTKTKEEKKGRITQIDSENISIKNDKFAIEQIYSISKKPSAGTEILGGIIGAAGMVILVGSVTPPSSIVSQNIRTETLLSGGILTAASILILYRKSYNHKKWSFEVINN